jgi:hypothetical protein
MKAQIRVTLAVLLVAAVSAAPCLAQQSRSAALTAQLLDRLSERKLDTVAAVVPGQPDRFVAASQVPGLGLLVLSARSSASAYLADCIQRKQYKDAYSYLNGTSLADGKLFIQDAGADGLSARRKTDGGAFDITYQNVTTQVMFDGDPVGQHLTDAQYRASFEAIDAQYAKILLLLIDELKK